MYVIMDQIFTGVVISIISAFIIPKLGIGNTKTTINIKNGSNITKKWKILTILGSIMVFGGGYYGLAWGMTVGFEDIRTLMGVCLFIVGLLVLAVGKLGIWWNH